MTKVLRHFTSSEYFSIALIVFGCSVYSRLIFKSVLQTSWNSSILVVHDWFVFFLCIAVKLDQALSSYFGDPQEFINEGKTYNVRLRRGQQVLVRIIGGGSKIEGFSRWMI